MRDGVSIVVVLGLFAVLAGGGYWLVMLDEASPDRTDDPGPMHFEPEEDPDPEPERHTEVKAFDPNTEPVELSPAQELLIRRAQKILGDQVPTTLTKSILEPEVLARAGDRIENDWRRILSIRSDFQKAAHARAQAELKAGRYREWESRRVRIPDPDAPGRMVERMSTPYDDQREDEFILAVAVPESGRRLRHVVRLDPASNSEYAKLWSDKVEREGVVRVELSAWLGVNLR